MNILNQLCENANSFSKGYSVKSARTKNGNVYGLFHEDRLLIYADNDVQTINVLPIFTNYVFVENHCAVTQFYDVLREHSGAINVRYVKSVPEEIESVPFLDTEMYHYDFHAIMLQPTCPADDAGKYMIDDFHIVCDCVDNLSLYDVAKQQFKAAGISIENTYIVFSKFPAHLQSRDLKCYQRNDTHE